MSYHYRKEDFELIENSSYFDSEWYLNSIGKQEKNIKYAVEHYSTVGWKYGFDPSQHFSTREYLMLNQDVKRAGDNPLLHFERTRLTEKRRIHVVAKDDNNSLGAHPGLKISQHTIFQGKGKCLLESPVQIKNAMINVTNVTEIGAFTYIEQNCMLSNVSSIGRFCSIAANVIIWNGSHGITTLSSSPIFVGGEQSFNEFSELSEKQKHFNKMAISKTVKKHGISIGNDVWIGNGAIILMGCTIGDGAIIGAGAVITKDVPPYAIVVGNPGRIVKYRFEPDIIHRLTELKWWDWGIGIVQDVRIDKVDESIKIIRSRINSGWQLYRAPIYEVENGIINRINNN